MIRLIAFICILMASPPAGLSAAVIRVPADQPTIQAGLDAASDGDTVLVADGVYSGTGNRNIQFYGKAVALRSENGSANCIIDGEAFHGHGFLFTHDEGYGSVLDGFTVRNFTTYQNGAGISCEWSSPTITNCRISGNVDTKNHGAGIYCEHASPLIAGCTIDNNLSNSAGGGIACRSDSAPVIRGNVILGNDASYGGGDGIFAEYSDGVTIEDNLITGNLGEGIHCHGSDAVITGNTITGHSAGGVYIAHNRADLVDNEISGNSGGRGAGLHVYMTSAYLSNCRILDNVCELSYEFGAGICLDDFLYARIDNCLIAGNSFAGTQGVGGGIFAYNGAITITNTTISGNTAYLAGALGTQSFSVAISDSILWGNDPAAIYNVTGYAEPVMTHCDVEGGWPGTGNLELDPLFAGGPGRGFYLSQQAAGQPVDSPCLDSGSGAASDTCHGALGTTYCMNQFSTRTDQQLDMGQVDMGYHYDADLTAGTPYLVTGPGPGQGNPPRVRLFPPEEGAAHIVEFAAYGATGYGTNVACGDLDGDGLAEILTGAGPGAIYGPHVRGFTMDGTPLPGLSFLAYGTRKYGVIVTAADLDGDGRDEIVTGAGPGAVFGPHVRGFSYSGDAVSPLPGVSWFAYGTLKWGVNVAGGDIDGDGRDEIVTGAGPGAVFGPHVRGWDVEGQAVTAMAGVSWFAYGTSRYGVRVACGDLDGDGIDEMVTAPGPSLEFASHIRGWNYDGEAVTELPGFSFFAWGSALPRFGARVAAGCDLDGAGRDDLVVGAGPDPSVGSPVRVFTYDGASVSAWFSLDAYPPGTTHGVNVASGRFAD